ncbi:MAG: site-2 protease family protein [Acidobacteria bacterium]|nr:site-2 protease family protein [Acidobacteriota bacterium]
MPNSASAAGRESSVSGTVAAFRLLGVPLRLHFTFILLAVFLIVLGLGGEQSLAMSAVYLAALFGSVLLHEVAHAAVSRRLGVRTLEIVMFPIGGVARLERNPKPQEEFWISLAGPFANLLIATTVLGWLYARGSLVPLPELWNATDANLLERIALGNLLLAAFNLLPAFPMDGGRILRSILATRMSEERATRIAARAGRFLAFGMGLYGLLSMQFLVVFVAFFVYLGAAQESAAAIGRALTQGIPVRDAMVTRFHTLHHGDTIAIAARLMLESSQQDFPVMHGGQVVGLLGRNSLLRAIATEGQETYVAGAMERDFPRLAPDTDLAEILPRMAHAGACALVMDEEALVGLLTAENLSEYLLLRRFGMTPGYTRPA